jgi:hypothetical protein
MSRGQVLGIVVGSLVLGVFFFNGLIMLISPARWFKLPSYISFRGSMSERDYLARLSGRLQIRTMGLFFVCVSSYVVCGLLGLFPRLIQAVGSKGAALLLPLGRLLCFITCLGVIGCGLVMLLSPKWWIGKYMAWWTEKFMSPGTINQEMRQVLCERIVRIMSVPVLAVGAFFLFQCTAVR